MNRFISIDLGNHPVYFDDIAEQIADNCWEGDFLVDLALQNEKLAKLSKDGTEIAFAIEAAKRLRDLATWFEENQP